jgi:hypothetical protein
MISQAVAGAADFCLRKSLFLLPTLLITPFNLLIHARVASQTLADLLLGTKVMHLIFKFLILKFSFSKVLPNLI